jgi:hypothetical protein
VSLPGHTALRLALERARAPKAAPAPPATTAREKTSQPPTEHPRPAPAPRPPRPSPAAAATPAPRQPRRSSAPAPRRASLRITDLQDLATVARHLREEKARQEAEDKARREAAARREAERHQFSHAVGPVTRLRDRNLARLRRPLPPPLPVQHTLDEQRVLLESISDDFDVSTLLDTDDQLSFRRPGIGVEITRRLRAGQGPGLPRQKPRAQKPRAALAGAKARSAGLCAGAAGGWRRGGPAGAVAAGGGAICMKYGYSAYAASAESYCF